MKSKFCDGYGKHTTEIDQRNTRLRRHTIDAHNANKATKQERSSDLRLLGRLHLETLEHEHGQTHCDDVGDGVETAHDLELSVQLDAVGFDVGSPCALDWMALEQDDEGLDETVGADETTDGPESDAEALIREDAVVEDEGGYLDARCSGCVELLDREGNLESVMSCRSYTARGEAQLTLAMATGSLSVTTCFALPYLMVPSNTPESSPMAKIYQYRISGLRWRCRNARKPTPLPMPGDRSSHRDGYQP